MSRRLGQLFLDRPVLTRRATRSNTLSQDGEHDTAGTGAVDTHDTQGAAAEASSSSDTDEDDPEIARRIKMDKLQRTLGKNVPAELVFGTHLAVSMYHGSGEPSPALSRTTSTTPYTNPAKSSSTVTTTLSTPAARPQTPWVAPWEDIDPESYARARGHGHANGQESPSSYSHNTGGRSFWKKAGEAAVAGVGAAIIGKEDSGRRGSEGGGSNSGSSGLGRRTSNDSSSAHLVPAPGSGHTLSLSVVRIDPQPPSDTSSLAAVSLRSTKPPTPSQSQPGSRSASAAGVGAPIAKGGMSSLSMIARGVASDVNNRRVQMHRNSPSTAPASVEKPRLNRRRATRMTNIFGLPGPATDVNADRDAGGGPEKRAMGKHLDAKSMAGLAYMLDYERDTLYDLLSRADADADPEWPYESESRRKGKGRPRRSHDDQQQQGHEQTRPTARQKQMTSPMLTSTSTSLTPHTSRASSLPPSQPHQQSRQRTPSPHPPFNKTLPLPPPHDPDLHHHHHASSPKRPYPPTTKRTYAHDHDEVYPRDLLQPQSSPRRADTQDVRVPSPKSSKSFPTDLATLQSRRTACLEQFFHLSYRALFESMVAFPGVEDDDESDDEGDDSEQIMDEATLRRVLGEKSWERICNEKRGRMAMGRDPGREKVVLAQRPSTAAAREGAGAAVSMMAMAELMASARTPAEGAEVTGLATPWPRPPRLESIKTTTTRARPSTSTSTAAEEVAESRPSVLARHRRSASLSLLTPPSGLAAGKEESYKIPASPTRAHGKAQSIATTSHLDMANGNGGVPLTIVSPTGTADSTSSSESESLLVSASPSASTSATSTTSTFGHHLKPHPNPLLLPPKHSNAFVGRSETPVPPSPPPFAKFWPAADQDRSEKAPEQLDQKYPDHPQSYSHSHPHQQQGRQQQTTTTAVHVQRKGVIKRVVSVSRAARGGVNGRDGGQLEWRKKGEDMQGVMNRLRELR